MKRLFAVLLAAAVLTTATTVWADGGPTALRIESQENPLAIEAAAPRFSWQADKGQTEYQILVASSADLLMRGMGDVWDSGRVASDETVQIPYAGKPLTSNQRVFWQVTTWNGIDEQKSPVASFSMGILKPGDWQAKWIAFPNDDSMRVMEPDPCFRKEFSLAKPIARAVVHICGLGQYEMMLNGERVGDHQIAPGWTVYQKTVNYDTYDVTSQLKQGANAVGVMLGNGMYNCLQIRGRYTKNNATWGFPKLIMQMEIEYADGTKGEINTDDSWKTARGPMVVDQEYGGEDYDARREFPGWDKPGFDEKAWSEVALTEAPGGKTMAGTAAGAGPGTAQLVAAINPPEKIMKVYEPVKVTQAGNGWLYDFGQNLSGWTHIKVKGPAGTVIKMTPGETAGRGSVSQTSSGGPMWWSYTLRGDATGEDWRPKFMYYGFRYVMVDGASPATDPSEGAKLMSITSEWVHANAPVIGTFESSDTTLNRIHVLIDGAILSNMQSTLTDCPHREKLGWLEQSHLMDEAISMNYDISNLYAKMCRDMRNAQIDVGANAGMIPNIAPEYVVFGPKDNNVPTDGFRDSPEWGSAGVINPWHLYEYYGDARILDEQYDAMKKYVAYLGSRATENIVSHGLGDWFDIGPKGPGAAQLTTRGLTATATYYEDIDIVRKTAIVLHRQQDVQTYTDLANRVKASFNDVFFNGNTNQYERGSQTADAMPLALGMVPEGKRTAVLANLVAAVRAEQNHVTAGDVGFSYVVRALTEGEQGQAMYDMTVNPNGRNGYVAILNSGATTLTEGWDGSHSHNHLMLGHAEAWFYRGLGGIHNAPGSIAFKQIVIRPEVVEGLASAGPTKWVHVSYNSPRGMIVSNWTLDGKKLTMDVTIPATSTALIYVPSTNPNGIISSGTSMGLNGAVANNENGVRVFAAKAGTYKFVSTLP